MEGQDGFATGPSNHQPVVDLGYEIYQAINEQDSNAAYYTFSTIRYAAPPVGDLRWREPVLPEENRSVVQSDPAPIACPQGFLTWQIRSAAGVEQYLASGVVPDVSYENLTTQVSGGQEDCLFLDVLAPKAVFDHVGSGHQVPVLVWVHGGGFTSGSKTHFGSPRGLIERGAQNETDSFIYVALNYRLGAFGFLAGNAFEKEGGLLNGGLFDQRIALQWVQDNIHLFGGDRKQVTVLGQSSGGGSIMHHITADGNGIKPLFRRAILQSPSYPPYRSWLENQEAFDSFMGLSNVTTLAQARDLPSEILVAANANSIGRAQPWEAPVYGPTPDKKLVLSVPNSYFRPGVFEQTVDILTGYNSNEGLLLAPFIHTNEEYEAFLYNLLPNADVSTITGIAERKSLYPPIFDGSMGYRNNYERAALTAADVMVNCHNSDLGLCMRFRNTSAYYFSVYPGIHGQELEYTFYTTGRDTADARLHSGVDTGPVNETLAYVLQDYIVSFVKTGKAASSLEGLVRIPRYGLTGHLARLDTSGVGLMRDPGPDGRCGWWFRGDYDW
ncbi:Alpha/Beta hydrolase protein [Aspergillus karnatakaensis]|uniref:Alpha/Beta hydrolase protein n=1 Tax=Aspergillus karnatakaensis TaxID=1810916 RepID=UPI003CCCBF52